MNNNAPYRLLVVEDEQYIRQNIIKKISQIGNHFELIGEAFDGESALKMVECSPPHLVITDIKMPIMDGMELIKNLYFAFPRTKVIIISGYSDFEYAKKAIQFGVKDFLLKPVSLEDLTRALNAIEILLDSENKKDAERMNLQPKAFSSNEVANYVEIYIRENYKKNFSVGELADKLGFTPDYLSKVFKKHTGQTLIRFITRLRINEAKRLLLQKPEIEIQVIGELVGYPDPFYFSRVFKKQTNVYPSEFITQQKKN